MFDLPWISQVILAWVFACLALDEVHNLHRWYDLGRSGLSSSNNYEGDKKTYFGINLFMVSCILTVFFQTQHIEAECLWHLWNLFQFTTDA